jgi:hypothetical protein
LERGIIQQIRNGFLTRRAPASRINDEIAKSWRRSPPRAGTVLEEDELVAYRHDVRTH